MSSANASNQAQIEYWNGRAGLRWASEQEALDHALAPFGDAAMKSAAPRVGERVIDIGCGAGATTLLLAEAVGASGAVRGVDVSAPMLARARERGAAFPNVEFLEADAASHVFASDRDLLFSRFGVMFFADPAAAFSQLRKALKSGGRVSFICWRQLSENPWMQVPLEAAIAVIGAPAQPESPHAPGPLAFADRDRLRNILESAGFSRIEIEPFDAGFVFSERGLDHGVDFAMRIGPTARMMAETTDELRAKARDALHLALAPHIKDNKVTLPAGTWVVTASRPDL